MDLGEEFWQLKRKPRFVNWRNVGVPLPNATSLRERATDNHSNMDEQFDRAFTRSQGHDFLKENYKNHNMLDCKQMFSGKPDQHGSEQDKLSHPESSRLGLASSKEAIPPQRTFGFNLTNKGKPDQHGSEQDKLSHPESSRLGLAFSKEAIPPQRTFGCNLTNKGNPEEAISLRSMMRGRTHLGDKFTRQLPTLRNLRRQLPLGTPMVSIKESTQKDGKTTLIPKCTTLAQFSTSKENGLQTEEFSNECEDSSDTQECCRALCFNDIQEGQENDDLTTPLDMLDMTAIISEPSVLKSDATEQDTAMRRYKLNRIARIQQSIPRKNSELDTNEVFVGGNDLERNLVDAEFSLLRKEVTKMSTRPRVSSTRTHISLSAEKVVSNKPILRVKNYRRSALPSLRHTPKYKINKELKVQNVSNIAKVTASKIPPRNQGKKTPKLEPRSISKKKFRRSVRLEIPKVIISQPEDKLPEAENRTKSVEMCDASTSTKSVETKDASTSPRNVLCLGKSPDKDIMKGIEALLAEQEEVHHQARLIHEQTISRRQKMKDSKLLKSFLTTVSPLQRLHTMIQERSFVANANPSCSNSIQPHQTEVNTTHPCVDTSVAYHDSDMDISFIGNANENESSMDYNVLNTTNDLNASQMKWKHLKLNSRVFLTPASRSVKKIVKVASPTDEEIFEDKNEDGDDWSPFTEMVGDCERPSLAPMTPHSHHQVSILKMSLRKQLNQLYES